MLLAFMRDRACKRRVHWQLAQGRIIAPVSGKSTTANWRLLLRTKTDVGRYVFEHTTRSKKWMRENGLQTWSPASPRLEPVEPGDEDKLYAAAGRPEDVLSVVAGGPAGGFCHIIHPFPGMGFSHPAVSQKIEVPTH